MELIDRQALIDEIAKIAKRLDNLDTINGLCGAVAIAMELPTIDTVSREDVISICNILGSKMDDEGRVAVEQVRDAVEDMKEAYDDD